jgi:microcompartment protein CcmK/EutM
VIIASVTGRATGTIKHPAYTGRTLLWMRTCRRDDSGGGFLAVDLVGDGVGDTVIVSRPPGLAREIVGGPAPIRSLIIGILDQPPQLREAVCG